MAFASYVPFNLHKIEWIEFAGQISAPFGEVTVIKFADEETVNGASLESQLFVPLSQIWMLYWPGGTRRSGESYVIAVPTFQLYEF